MRVRFQADADLNQLIVRAVLRLNAEIDFQTAHAANFARLDDLAVLALAAEQGRVLVSHDRRTMPGHFGRFILDRQSPGLLIVSRMHPIARIAEDLLLIWTASSPDEWINRIRSLPL